MTKYPEITVQLTGMDGNAMSVIAAVSKALKRAGLPDAATDFVNAAIDCESYDDLLRLCMNTVAVE